MAAYNIPIGYVFKPSWDELIGYFLTEKLHGKALLPCFDDILIDYDVYTDHPSNIMDLTRRNEDEDGFRQGYFFTPLKKTSRSLNGKRVSRVVSSHGTWLEKSATKEVYDEEGEVIGVHKYYKFKPFPKSNHDPLLNKDEWVMHEYSLVDNLDLVLSHISNKKDNTNGNNKKGIRATRVRKMDDFMLTGYEAGPMTKRGRVDTMNEIVVADPLELISYDNVDDNNNGDLFENGYKNVTEPIVGQQDHILTDDIITPIQTLDPLSSSSMDQDEIMKWMEDYLMS